MQKTLQKIFSYIPHENSANYTFFTHIGLKRQQYLLELLGNPQNQLKIIHIAGTSGKGSTASFISKILVEHGFKTGLTVSPHLIDIRERVQINDQLISEEKFTQYFSEIEPAILKTAQTEFGKPTYFEVMATLFFYVFAKEKVDYAVIETGMGGLWDGTNTVNRSDKVAVITAIGFDHTRFLGNTLTLIAGQKSGIINEGNRAFSIKQRSNVRKVFDDRAKLMKTQINFVTSPQYYSRINRLDFGLSFDYHAMGKAYIGLTFNTFAIYQVENCALAITVCEYLARRDGWNLVEVKLRTALNSWEFKGRMSIRKIKDKVLILDGAHNPQKMRGFIESLKKIPNIEKYAFVIAIKQSKDYKNMLKYITPIAKKIYITQFKIYGQDLIQISESPEVIAKNLMDLGFKNFEIIPEAKEAVAKALSEHQGCIATGSLYLMSDIYSNL